MAETVILAERVSKRFLLHHNYAPSIKARVLGMVHRRSGRRPRTSGRSRRPRQHLARRIGRAGRPQRVWQEHAAEADCGHLSSNQRPAAGPRDARIGTMIELGVGFNVELTGRDNVYLNASIYGLAREEVDAIYDQVVDYAELAKFIDEPIKNYSSGMIVRLAFAVAAHLNPEVLLLDEIFAVGDAPSRRSAEPRCGISSREGAPSCSCPIRRNRSARCASASACWIAERRFSTALSRRGWRCMKGSSDVGRR